MSLFQRDSLNLVFLYLRSCAPMSSNMSAMAEQNLMEISRQVDRQTDRRTERQIDRIEV